MLQGWRLGGQRGTSTLEFIVVLPVLLIIFLGGLELSRAWLTANIATNAAREGARVAVAMDPVNPADPSFANAQAAGDARVDEILAAANLSAANSPPYVTCPGTCPTDSQVTSTVTINFDFVAPLFFRALGISSPLVLTETTIMRRE